MIGGSPLFNQDTFNRHAYLTGVDPRTLMTVRGTIGKLGLLFAITIAFAVVGVGVTITAPGIALPVAIGGGITAFLVAILLAFKKELAPILAPLYAVLQGTAVGVISLVFETRYPGIVFNAISLTFGILAAMILVYAFVPIAKDKRFLAVIGFATVGIMICYVINLIMMMFGQSIPMIHDSGPIGIGFSIFVCIIASLNFLTDFNLIEEGVEAGAPKYMEWYGAFGVLVTLIWLYIEILRLLAKLRR